MQIIRIGECVIYRPSEQDTDQTHIVYALTDGGKIINDNLPIVANRDTLSDAILAAEGYNAAPMFF